MMLTWCSSNSLHHLEQRARAGPAAGSAAAPAGPSGRGRAAARWRAGGCRYCRRVSTRPTLRPANRSRMREHRGEPGRAGAFDHGLLDLQQQADRRFEVALADQHDVVDQRARRSREVNSPGSLTAMPSASVSPPHGRSSPLNLAYIDGIELGLRRRSASIVRLAAPWRRCPCPRSARRRRSGRPACRARARPRASRARPCPGPAMTCGSSNGWTKVRPSSGAPCCARAHRPRRKSRRRARLCRRAPSVCMHLHRRRRLAA